MAKGRYRDDMPVEDRPGPQKAVLFEMKGRREAEDGAAPTTCTEMFAALSLEEVLAHVRKRQTSVEIVELKALGKIHVLSSSENLV